MAHVRWWMVALACLLVAPNLVIGADGDKPEGKTVPKIVSVKLSEEEINPPNLLVTVVGEVTSSGFKDAKLTRVVHVTPPADGIQDYTMTAVPPAAGVIVTPALTPIEAKDRWINYKKDAPWIKGVRVHGVGDGVVVKMFGGGGDEAGERSFEGDSKEGIVQDALAAALKKLDGALSEGGVADALASWKIAEVSGQRGGIAGQRGVKVKITATRTPAWETK